MTIDPTKQLPGGVLTFNEVFFDSVIRHQIGLMRLSGSISKRVIALLDATEQDMADKIRSRLIGRRGLNTPADVIRMQRLIKVLRGTRITAWKQVTALWVKEMQDLAVAEPGFMDGLLKSSVPVILDTVIPQTSFLKAIVTSKPFEGQTMKQWADTIARADLTRIEQQIRIGMVQGETGPQIARRIVGTKRLRGVNGVTEITRRQAVAVTRTAVNGIANHAKRLYYVENKDLFTEEMYVATLDSRTTHICMSLDGNRYEIGKGPIPPVHFQCRSMRVAVLTPEVIGNRPIRQFTQKGLVREYSRQNGLKVQGNRANLPRGHKGPFDSFAQKRMRDLTGRAPAKTTYQEFLGRQTSEFQNDVLGVSRGKLFRDGGLTLDKFVDQTGKLFTLEQLAAAHGAAFKAAGVAV
jgi:SPP1 gp7 family putative phage head morphogenesis protein